MMARGLTLMLVACFGLTLAACGRPRLDTVKGPDGDSWTKITCRHLDKRCFKAAAKKCPDGYIFAKNPVAAKEGGEHAKDDDDDDAHAEAAKSEAAKSEGAKGEKAPATEIRAGAKKLPPQDNWGDEMYSERPGTLLVKCGDRNASRD